MKTNFLKTVKHSMFLLLAILSTFIGYSQNPTIGGKSQEPTVPVNIGGSKTPGDNGGLISPNDTGGRTPGGIGLITSTDNPSDFGGRQDVPTMPIINLRVTDCEFAFLIDTGGKGTSTDTGQVNDPNDIDPYDIGGRSSNSGTGLLTDIGGRNDTSTGGNICDIGGRGTSSDTGQVDDDDSDPFDVGGNGGVIIGRPAIGGRDSGGGLLTCTDTGGRNGGGTSTTGDRDSDIGGGKGSSDPIGQIAFTDDVKGCILRPEVDDYLYKY